MRLQQGTLNFPPGFRGRKPGRASVVSLRESVSRQPASEGVFPGGPERINMQQYMVLISDAGKRRPNKRQLSRGLLGVT